MTMYACTCLSLPVTMGLRRYCNLEPLLSDLVVHIYELSDLEEPRQDQSCSTTCLMQGTRHITASSIDLTANHASE